MRLYRNESKIKEQALQMCLEESNANINEVFKKEEEIAGSLLKKTKYIAEVITKEDVKNEIREFISHISNLMSIKIDLELEEDNGIFKVYLSSDNNSILIGRDGRTMKSIQIILRQSIIAKTGFSIKINVDVSGYKEKKLKQLENTIKRVASEVIQSRIDAKLDPMNSYERRFVHNIVNEYTMLETRSDGEEPERYVIISYKQD